MCQYFLTEVTNALQYAKNVDIAKYFNFYIINIETVIVRLLPCRSSNRLLLTIIGWSRKTDSIYCIMGNALIGHD